MNRHIKGSNPELMSAPRLEPEQTAESAPLPAEIADVIVEALVAAVLASFKRDPLGTGGSGSGTDHTGEEA